MSALSIRAQINAKRDELRNLENDAQSVQDQLDALSGARKELDLAEKELFTLIVKARRYPEMHNAWKGQRFNTYALSMEEQTIESLQAYRLKLQEAIDEIDTKMGELRNRKDDLSAAAIACASSISSLTRALHAQSTTA